RRAPCARGRRLNVPATLPFDDSRRLTGANLFFGDTGAVLETRGIAPDDALLASWRTRAERARGILGWPVPGAVARVHVTGASLAIAAPSDLLFLATEVNEWAWCASVQERDPSGWPDIEAGLLEEVL